MAKKLGVQTIVVKAEGMIVQDLWKTALGRMYWEDSYNLSHRLSQAEKGKAKAVEDIKRFEKDIKNERDHIKSTVISIANDLSDWLRISNDGKKYKKKHPNTAHVDPEFILKHFSFNEEKPKPKEKPKVISQTFDSVPQKHSGQSNQNQSKQSNTNQKKS